MVAVWPSRGSSRAVAVPTMPAPMTAMWCGMGTSLDLFFHAVELRPTVTHILQIGLECGRRIIHPQRGVGWVLPELHLHLLADLLLRCEVRRIEPGVIEGLHLRIGRPAEPR